MLGLIKNFILDFILYFVTASKRKDKVHCNIANTCNIGAWGQHKIQYTSFEEVNKKYFMKNSLQP